MGPKKFIVLIIKNQKFPKKNVVFSSLSLFDFEFYFNWKSFFFKGFAFRWLDQFEVSSPFLLWNLEQINLQIKAMCPKSLISWLKNCVFFYIDSSIFLIFLSKWIKIYFLNSLIFKSFFILLFFFENGLMTLLGAFKYLFFVNQGWSQSLLLVAIKLFK